ncbi:AsmA family protein [Chitinophaga sp. SYP-B3965]|uniref:AsmA family protein n=1 Tax=Chitinophaga sp. SYP-B3965 TaxID=2663120 RepID=UPI001299C121|nr:AsmA-like C-terminal region-containing protein [Chitinophaga sp. SYP-B3965]MRG44585.1 AsmA family protein [Chitinophaga sp. SYP-B3965]
MPRWLRISLISAGSFIVLIILLWLILALVIRNNKQAILTEISSQLSSRINGTLVIRDMDPSLIRSFPNISITLKDVSLQDSLFAQHKRPLLAIKEVYVKVNTMAFLHKEIDIKEVKLKDGNISIFTDSTGYSNTYLFKGDSTKKKTGKQPTFRSFSMENIQFSMENLQKFKHFFFDIRSLSGEMDYASSGWTCNLRTDMHIRNLEFNTTKGSFAQNKVMQTDLEIQYITASKTLRIPPQILQFDKQPVSFGGEFNFSQQPAAFVLAIKADQIPFRQAASLLTPALAHKMDSISFEKPLDVHADIRGHMKFRDTPYIRVTWDVKDNILTAKAVTLDKCSFNGAFLNEVTTGMGHNDANSRLSLFNFKGEYDSIPVTSDTIRIINLKKPVLTGRFKSKFPLTRLTHIVGAHLFEFTKGEAEVDLEYAGTWNPNDTVPGFVNGIIQIKDGAFTYVPRNQTFQQCLATLDFTGQDLYFRNIRLQSGSSAVTMEGNIRNILNFYFAAPEKITLDWSIHSSMINLNEFHSFFAKRRKHVSKKQPVHAKPRIMKQLDVVLEACSVNMNVVLDKVKYRQFTASNVKAGIQLSQTGVKLDNAVLQAAGGQINFNGAILNASNGNDRFTVDAKVNKVQVDQLFRAFENFGQEGIQAKNLKGVFSATAKVTGGMKEDASIKPHSMFGSVTFDLNKGALVGFEPLEKLGKFVFRKRDMSNITFENIHNTLDIKGNKIVINPMIIASSVLNIQLEGTYGMPKGTDIQMKVPLRNPKNDELSGDAVELTKRQKKGIVVNLRAVDGDDGKVKFKLGKGKDED